MNMPRVVEHYIGGKWTNTGTRAITRTSPWDFRKEAVIYPDGTAGVAQLAMSAAADAQRSWTKIPAPERARMIGRAREILVRRKDEFATMMVLEAGKTQTGAEGEVAKTVKILDYCSGHGTRLGGFSPAAEQQGVRTYSKPRPLGVVAIISPFNFPLAVPVWKLAPALIAGNTVVWKPSDLTPGTSALIMEIFIEAGVPGGVLNLVHGGAEVGKALVESPDVQGVSFTGSTSVGREIYCMAAKRGLDKVVCEMGGQNGLIVLADADLGKAADDIVTGAFGAAGQRCTATSRVIVDHGVYGLLLRTVIEKARALTPEMVGPLISSQALDHVLACVKNASEAVGVELRSGGGRIIGGEYQFGNFMEPTIFEVHDLRHSLWTKELFGPVVAFMDVSSYREAVVALNANPFGHAASLYTNDHGLIERFPDDAEVGMIHVNEPTIGGEAHLGFGGFKATGIGPQEMGDAGLEFFVRRQTVSVNWGGAKISAGTR